MYKAKDANSGGSKHLSIHFPPHRPRPVHISTQNERPNPSELDSKVLIPAPTYYLLTKTIGQMLSPIANYKQNIKSQTLM